MDAVEVENPPVEHRHRPHQEPDRVFIVEERRVEPVQAARCELRGASLAHGHHEHDEQAVREA